MAVGVVERAAPTLAQKLCDVMLEVERVRRDGRNDFFGYRFASAEQVFTVLRRPLAERGILLLPQIKGISERDFKTPKGKDSTLTTATFLMTFRDAATGEEIACEWAGCGDDPADKGLYKAMTGAVRTFLRDSLLLPQGDDPESDRRTDERGASRRHAAPEPELTVEQRDRMLASIEEAGIRGPYVQVFLTAAGVGDLDHVKKSEAHALAKLLEDHKAGQAA